MSLAFDEYGRPFIIVKVRMVALAYVLSTAHESAGAVAGLRCLQRVETGHGYPHSPAVWFRSVATAECTPCTIRRAGVG
jgi:hypothetical protein